jgi:hypothetical protein
MEGAAFMETKPPPHAPHDFVHFSRTPRPEKARETLGAFYDRAAGRLLMFPKRQI